MVKKKQQHSLLVANTTLLNSTSPLLEEFTTLKIFNSTFPPFICSIFIFQFSEAPDFKYF